MKGIITISLLVLSNIFMTIAWYGHLKMVQFTWFQKLSLFGIILLSWSMAFFEYCAMIPANKIGFKGNGGPFNLMQLKVIQEVITLVVFTVLVTVFFEGITFKWNHAVAFVLLVGAVYFIFNF